MKATMAKFKRCKVGSAEQHNARQKDYIDRVNASPKKQYSLFEDRLHLNQFWVNPEYAGKTLPEVFNELKKLYTEKTGRKPPLKDRIRVNKKTGKEYTVSGWSPIREAIVILDEHTTVDDFKPFLDWLQTKGVTPIRIDLHRDEGWTDELTGERKYNLHAHLICDWVDHNTGRTAKLSDDDMPEMQTQIAKSLGMERGKPKSETGAVGYDADVYRAKKAAEKVKELQTMIDDLNEKIWDLQQYSDYNKVRGKLNSANYYARRLTQTVALRFDDEELEEIKRVATAGYPQLADIFDNFVRQVRQGKEKAEEARKKPVKTVSPKNGPSL